MASPSPMRKKLTSAISGTKQPPAMMRQQSSLGRAPGGATYTTPAAAPQPGGSNPMLEALKRKGKRA